MSYRPRNERWVENCRYLSKGDPKGTHWVAPECDVSIREGWFWHKSESPKSVKKLLKIYYNSVGRNCVLLINVPPNSTGLIPQQDAHTLKHFKSAIDTIFSTNLAQDCSLKASSQRGGKDGAFGPQNVLDDDHLWTYWAPRQEVDDDSDHWIEIRSQPDRRLRFNVVRIQEAIGLGQRIKRHEIYLDGKMIVSDGTVGYKRLHRIGSGVVSGHVVRVRFTECRARAVPLISSLGLHLDPFWDPTGLWDALQLKGYGGPYLLLNN